MSLFPIFLKLTGRPCLVVGAGNLGESKIESLQAANARVTVIAPRASQRIVALAEAGEVLWHQREYAPGDVAGQFLVVAATDAPEVNRAVFAEAEAANILINAVDDPPFCDFYFPSVVRRGDLQIAISTAGASPALAQRLRKEINAILPLDAGDWLAELGNLRREVLQLEPLNTARKELLHQLASREVCGYDACPSRQMARAHARTNPIQHPPAGAPADTQWDETIEPAERER
ncbi:MAG: bifunctional precorrin-2 dehydrogenase/sirohydrochlorin ferrochelatase [Acidobacteriaceae bacterium]